jgi:hypothetical protein
MAVVVAFSLLFGGDGLAEQLRKARTREATMTLLHKCVVTRTYVIDEYMWHGSV